MANKCQALLQKMEQTRMESKYLEAQKEKFCRELVTACHAVIQLDSVSREHDGNNQKIRDMLGRMKKEEGRRREEEKETIEEARLALEQDASGMEVAVKEEETKIASLLGSLHQSNKQLHKDIASTEAKIDLEMEFHEQKMANKIAKLESASLAEAANQIARLEHGIREEERQWENELKDFETQKGIEIGKWIERIQQKKAKFDTVMTLKRYTSTMYPGHGYRREQAQSDNGPRYQTGNGSRSRDGSDPKYLHDSGSKYQEGNGSKYQDDSCQTGHGSKYQGGQEADVSQDGNELKHQEDTALTPMDRQYMAKLRDFEQGSRSLSADLEGDHSMSTPMAPDQDPGDGDFSPKLSLQPMDGTDQVAEEGQLSTTGRILMSPTRNEGKYFKKSVSFANQAKMAKFSPTESPSVLGNMTPRVFSHTGGDSRRPTIINIDLNDI